MRIALLALALSAASMNAAAADDPWHAKARDMLEQAIAIPTVAGRGKVPLLAQSLADRYRAAGWADSDIHVLPYDASPQDHTAALIVRWPAAGKAKAKPIMLLAHQDVVPIAPGTEGDWQIAPFSGEVKDGFVWGRGSWDDKGNLLSQLEAVELLVASGYKPPRTIYLAFGADEEVGGMRGAAKVSALLKSRGVQLDFVIDEGLLVLEGVMPGIAKPTALIGVAEKGYMSVVLKMSATPGHSSMPPKKGTSAIAMMSAALNRLEDEQLPAGIRGVARPDRNVQPVRIQA